MPYPRAHWYLLALFPLTLLAFWRGYFADLPAAPAAFHFHGVTASLWIALLAAQSWLIHGRRREMHRTLGLASFALFPLFLTGGLLVVRTMGAKFGAGTDPFYELYGARLGAMDAWSTLCIPILYHLGLKQRRKVHLHARYMLATVFFLLMPILSRIFAALPPISMEGRRRLNGAREWGPARACPPSRSSGRRGGARL